MIKKLLCVATKVQLILILLITISVFGQNTPKTISMSSSDNNNTAFSTEGLIATSITTFYTHWDTNYLYIGWSEGATNYSSDMYYVAIDTDPNTTAGTGTAIEGVSFATGNHLPDYYSVFENNSNFYGIPESNGNAIEFYDGTSGSWNFISRTNGNDNTNSKINFTESPNGEVRIRIAWTALNFTPGDNKPIGITYWTNNPEGNYMWSRYPDSNPLPGATSKVLTHQIIFNSTGSGINPSTSFYENSYSENIKYTSNADGHWNDVNNWVYKGIPTIGGDITVDHNLILDVDTTIETATINAGSSLTLNTGTTLTVTNDLTLNSDSDLYSSLISDGAIIGTVNYNRYVNTYNSTPGSSTGQNDLISAPVTNASQTFGEFRANNGNIPSGTVGGTTMYLFGPFDNNNASAPYTLYSASDDSVVITAGTGFRTGSTNASTFTFMGDVETGTVPVNISMGSAFNWNLIGNPYTSYINSGDFLTENAAALDENAVGIYGYDGSAQDGWIILNFNTMNTAENLAPGQGFMVAAEATSTLNFTPSMRRLSGGDDFIDGRASEQNLHLRLKLEKTNASCHTDFYFNANSTQALDPGYDAKVFNGVVPDFYMYSHLVEDNQGQQMAIQSLNNNDLTNVTIPLGISANQGETVTFSIATSNLSNTTQIYLEDNVTNTFTLLNANSYTTTLNSNLNSIGRFYLRVTDTTLSTFENQLNNFNIYSNSTNETIIISGELLEKTTARIYDLQGRIVTISLFKNTNSRLHTIDVSNLNMGVYVIELTNGIQNKTQKIIIH